MLEKQENKYFVLSVAFALTASIFFVLLPLVDIDGTALQAFGAYVAAAGFWISIIAEITFTILCRRAFIGAEHKKSHSTESGKPGIVAFFSNKEAKIADLVFLLSFVIMLILIFLHIEIKWLEILCVFVVFLSFNIHCILNGKNYKSFIENIK